MTQTTTYSVVVESGSCSPDYQRWEERANCGHKHRTLKAALACMARLTAWICDHGRKGGKSCSHCGGLADGRHTSATWYGARLHDQDEHRVEVD